jgi:hypothetical protein
MNRDYNGGVKRKARRWWIVGGVGFLVAAGIYLSSPTWSRPYGFLHHANYEGMSQNVDGSLTFRIYRVPNEKINIVLTETLDELIAANGWKPFERTDHHFSYVKGDDYIEFVHSKSPNDGMTVLVRRPARVIDKWLVDLPWNKQ